MQQRISAILLAAGLSQRAGAEDKLLLKYDGKPILQHAVDLLSGLPKSPVFEKIIVTSLDKSGHIRIPEGVKLILNKKPEIGQSESIRLGIRAATGNFYMFMVADQPKLTVEDIEPLIMSALSYRDKIIYPTIEGSPTTPTIFPAFFKNELQALTGDNGGKEIRNNNPKSRVAIKIKNPDNFLEIDTMADFYKLFTKGR